MDLPALQRPIARQVQEDPRALGAGAGKSAGGSVDRWIFLRYGHPWPIGCRKIRGRSGRVQEDQRAALTIGGLILASGLDHVLAAVGDPDGAVLVDADPIAGAAIA
jgi:hypothetical protein